MYVCIHVSMSIRYLVLIDLLRDKVFPKISKKKENPTDRPTRLTVVPLIEPHIFFWPNDKFQIEIPSIIQTKLG